MVIECLYVLGTVLGAWYVAGNKTDKNSAFLALQHFNNYAVAQLTLLLEMLPLLPWDN